MNKREKVFLKTNGKCIYCGCNITFDDFHIEHMYPKSKLKYNKNDIDNLFPACPDCNYSKGCLELEDFREKIEDLIFDDNKCRIVAKYYNVRPKNILFYFEKCGGIKWLKKNK